MPIAGKDANLRITSGVATTSTGEAATRSTGLGASTSGPWGYVQITSTAHRHLDPDSTPALYLEAPVGVTTSLVSSALYNVQPINGKFLFSTSDPSTGTYTADIEWLTASQVSGGREWSLNVETDMFEVSEFGSAGWKQYQPNLNGATVSLSKYWTDPAFFDLFNTEAKFIVELVVDSSQGWKYEGFVRLAADQVGTPTDGLVSESLNCVFDGPVLFST
jgi:hypothetical protein